MIEAHALAADPPPAFLRLASITRLDEASRLAIADALRFTRVVKPRREIMREGAPIKEMLLMISGWAARVRQLEDGRRQIMSFLLPGDLIGNCRHTDPLAVSSVIALTRVEFCTAPQVELTPSLAEAYALSHALEESYLLAQITRLGRLNAEERLADLMLELHERMGACGIARRNGFPFPLTQETLADATGLSAVHLNRTLQSLRRQGDIAFRSGYLTLSDPVQLARRVGRNPHRVTDRGERRMPAMDDGDPRLGRHGA